MSQAPPHCASEQPFAPAQWLRQLEDAGAAQFDPVGWHYIAVLAERSSKQTGPVQALLQRKLHSALTQLQTRLQGHENHTVQPPRRAPSPSPLSALLQDMAAPSPERPLNPGGQGRMDNPRVAQFRQQLHKISVQKQITQAIAQAPQNAGPINSHMLVLRSLGLMRDLSPDYLNRFMAYVDTLMLLDMPEAETVKVSTRKNVSSRKTQR